MKYYCSKKDIFCKCCNQDGSCKCGDYCLIQVITNDPMLGITVREAARIAIDALEKQNPKKPIRILWEIACPSCRKVIGSYPYCAYCGQAIDWSEE